jgi:signal transduction histidine kinase/CheY-like chemotaxis protein
MKSGIGVKLVILATVLVVVTSALVLVSAKRTTEGVVLEHEVLDLGDETQLRAVDLRSEFYALRSDVEELSRCKEIQQVLEGRAVEVPQGILERSFKKNYLWMEVLTVDGGGAGAKTLAVYSDRHGRDPSLVKVTQVANRDAFLKEIEADLWKVQQTAQEDPEKTTRNRTIVSAIERVDVSLQGVHEPEKVTVLWAGTHVKGSSSDPTSQHVVIIAALDLEARLPANISSSGDDQSPLRGMTSDPRHLAVLANQPAAGQEFTPQLLVFPWEEDQQLISESDLVTSLTALYTRKRNDVMSECKAASQQDGTKVSPRYVINYPGKELPLLRPLWYMQSSDLFTEAKLDGLPNTQEDRLARVVEPVLEEFAAAKPRGSRFGRLLGGVKNFRLLARSRDDAYALAKEINARLEQEWAKAEGSFKKVDVHWYRPVRCGVGYVHFVLFPVRSDNSEGGQRFYGLAQVAFAEEMAADVADKMWGLVWWCCTFVLAAAGLGFVFSQFLARPLKQITATAQAVAETKVDLDPANGAWRDDISNIARQLPVRRRDEIGVLARVFAQMLDEVIEGHERLRELNAGLDRRVRERTEELEAANNELKAARDKAHELSRAKDAFLASVSHELRNPLNQVSGFCQLIEMTDLSDEQRADLQKIRMAASQLLTLINDILDYQKIIMGGITLEPSAISVSRLLEEVRDAMKFQFPENGNHLEMHCGEDVGELFADQQRVRQVLLNLTSNACKLTRNGTISLRASRVPGDDGDVIVFDVIDTGRGMTPDEQSKLFRPFVKFASKQGNQSGTGLGLVICKGFCEMMHGSISLRSEYGKGSTFTVRLPADTVKGRVVKPASSGDDSATRTSTSETSAGEMEHERQREQPGLVIDRHAARDDMSEARIPAGSARIVLVVDDDANVREMMHRYLETQGFRVITAADGFEGLELAKRMRPAVITLDAIMPGLDGWAVLAALRTDRDTSSIPVVMVTITDDEKRGYSLGAAEFVSKPIDWDRLSKVLANYTGEKRDRSILVVDDQAEDREILRRNLERDGWSVLEAEHGKAALELLATERPAAILLDLMMPVMDGFEFLAEYCQLAEWLSIPVVVITAKDPSPEELTRLEGSVVRVLQKGRFSHDELLREIHRRVDKHIRTATSQTKEEHDAQNTGG